MARSDLFPSLYFRDWQNANRLKPNYTPPRQNFNGFVEFVFNPDIEPLISDGVAFRTQISSLVQNAKLPEVRFNTAVKNQYNMKRVVQTGVEYSPVDIEVLDTVNNEWLIVFMRYFSYFYMNPRNKTTDGQGNKRDQDPKHYPDLDYEMFDSNVAGFNLNKRANFIDKIKLVTYAGGRGVEYILFKPTITAFSPGQIDYSSSEVRKFGMSFEYENFTVNQTVNFTLDDLDRARFESYNTLFTSDVLDALNKYKPGFNRRDLDFMGDSSSTGKLNRSSQPVVHPAPDTAVNDTDGTFSGPAFGIDGTTPGEFLS